MKNKNKLIWTIVTITFVLGSMVTCGLLYTFYIGLKSLSEPREISYAYNLPKTATDIHEKTDYLQAPPDEEYRYYLKAKITENEFLEFAKELKLEWASPIPRDGVPRKNTTVPWWNPPSSMFLYAKGNGSDYIMQADYVSTTGYMYLYVTQN